MSAVSYAPQPDATQPAFVKGWHWVVAIFVPPLGAILGIIAMTKSQVGKGIGLLAVSTVSFVVALVILMSMAAAGSVAAVDSAVKDMEKAAATPSQVDRIAKGDDGRRGPQDHGACQAERAVGVRLRRRWDLPHRVLRRQGRQASSART